MADIAGALKAEITRLSKKTVRQAVASLQRSSTAHRHDIAALKKKLDALDRSVGAMHKAAAKKASAPKAEEAPNTRHRFSAKGLRTQRTRLGISQEDLANLVGVSAQSVYNWERGTAHPRPPQLAAIAEIRTLGKREVRRRLEERASE